MFIKNNDAKGLPVGDHRQYEKVHGRWMTSNEAANYLRVSRRTLQRMRDHGKVKYFQSGSRIIRYRKEDLDAYLEQFVMEPFAQKGGQAA